MEFDENKILSIIETHFWDELYQYVMDYVMDMDGSELADYFDMYVDYADLDGINSLSADEIELEEDGAELTVMGTLEAEVCLTGYSYWDGENIPAGSIEHTMGLTFNFKIMNGKYYEFKLENLF